MRQEIADLEDIANRTPQQEKKLQELKEKLARLESSSEIGGDKKPTNYLPWIIVSVLMVGAIIGLIIYFPTRKKNE